MQTKNRPPTIADVAERAGVFIATVRRVLNGSTPVQLEKSERMRFAMDEMQFVPRTAARVLANRRTNTIGLILPEISGAFFPPAQLSRCSPPPDPTRFTQYSGHHHRK